MTPKRVGGLLAASCAALHHGAASAMVLAPRPQTMPHPTGGASPLAPPLSRSAATRRRFRIRRTRASDLHVISSMLAEESVPTTGMPNWNDGVKRLRAKSQFEKQLAHRLAAIEEGRKTIDRMKQQFAEYEALCSLSDDDACHLLWTNDIFRSKLRNAVMNSQEANAWTVHGFELTPSPEMLNHVMMTVEDTSSGEVVGFSEVAWLPTPASYTADDDGMQQNNDAQKMQVYDDSLDIPVSYSDYCEETLDSYCDGLSTQPYDLQGDTSMQCAPAIVNLVTSTSHRRLGIASRVLNFASKYTRTQWRCGGNIANELGLYVHPENESALRLYINKGFSVVSSECEDGLLYMMQR